MSKLDEIADRLDPADAAEIREFRDYLAMRKRARAAEAQLQALRAERRTPGPATAAMLAACKEWLDGKPAAGWPDRARAFIAEWSNP